MGNAAIVVSLILGLLDRATAIGDLLKKAKAEGRDITDEELNALVAEDDAARETLQQAIDKARAEGR